MRRETPREILPPPVTALEELRNLYDRASEEWGRLCGVEELHGKVVSMIQNEDDDDKLVTALRVMFPKPERRGY